jgi:hypothetical protein
MRRPSFCWALLLAGVAPACCAEDPYRARVEALRRRLPDSGFHAVVEPPFLVIGDEPAARVERWARGTIRWAVDHLKALYFTRDPEPIIEVWLFRDGESYMTNARRVFGQTPTTEFGYYSPQHRALVMNIGTGGGTLVHEIVHPYIGANFPRCPPWFNEGLASLYEQCDERDGSIVGLTNWRLEPLQAVIRRGTLPTFRALTAMSAGEFHGEHEGRNYAQARYLCYYLQEQGLLGRYYHEFRREHGADPSGYRTLTEVLGREDMQALQLQWEAWVSTLRHP